MEIFILACKKCNFDVIRMMNIQSLKDIDLSIYRKEALYYIVYRNTIDNLRILQYLHMHGHNIHVDDDFLLRISARKGYIEFVKYLVETGADVHAKGDEALRKSAKKGYLDVVQYLVEHGANINAHGGIPLQISSGRGHLSIVQYLVEWGADIHANDDMALCMSADKGHLHVVRYLVEHGANIKARHNMPLPLWWSASNGHLNVVRYLVEQGADIETYKVLFLCISAEKGHFDVVQYLVEQGADVNMFSTHRGNWRPIVYAAMNGHVQIVKYLVEHGAYEQIGDAIEKSINNHHMDVVRYFMEKGYIHESGYQNIHMYLRSALYKTTTYRIGEDIVRYLIEMGGDFISPCEMKRYTWNVHVRKGHVHITLEGGVYLTRWFKRVLLMRVYHLFENYDNNDDVNYAVCQYFVSKGCTNEYMQNHLFGFSVRDIDDVKSMIGKGKGDNIVMQETQALYVCAYLGFYDILVYLFGFHKVCEKKHYSHLCVSVEMGHLDIVRYLLEHGSFTKNVLQDMIRISIRKNYLGITNYLLSRGATIKDIKEDKFHHDVGHFVFSYGLHPEDYRPTGTLNLSRMQDANLRL